MLSRQASHALKALLALAADPLLWRSTHELAIARGLPEPMLEQLLLRLRRAGLLEARRGRLGGYRLARPAREVSVAAILEAVAEPAAEPADAAASTASPADQVTGTLQRRLERARLKALEELSLEDLLFDLRSAEASTDSGAGLLLG
ncbi:Rrf2 family transcriptional regulator [Cyanobium sp. CH-040]|uniref:Rrf2 family transcriptional regulator n=1 Tax=Cyanobium sp. CH-040 TaxID=2823708 RepID=UPI0020CD81E5|nr:Rrf2 family transcriptional regulator [Cyanobium sp. CH-040]MCP9926833.1 Rrf2 family transcriptional regulator [Cyanobium sp. CH-040]